MNMYMQGVDPELDFSDMPKLCHAFESFTGMSINPRSPYCGSLVFAAFSGSHQDAIAKGMHWIEEKAPDTWTVPYLPIDPTISEETTMQTSSASTASLERAVSAIFWRRNTA